MADDPIPSPELDIVRDMAKRALPLGAVLVAACAIVWRGDGAATAAFAVAVVVLNMVASAAIMAWTGRISVNVLMAGVLGGFIVRMAVVAGSILAVKDQPWVILPLLAFTVLGAQLGLLAWESRFVSGSLAYPGLKPRLAKETRR